MDTMLKKIIIFFHRKKIVHSRTYAPAQFFYAFTSPQGKKHIRVIQTNRANSKNSNPMFDIPVSQVVGIVRQYSPFQWWLFDMIGYTPKRNKLRPLKK